MHSDDEFLGDEYDLVRVDSVPRELECCMLGALVLFRRRLLTQLFHSSELGSEPF